MNTHDLFKQAQKAMNDQAKAYLSVMNVIDESRQVINSCQKSLAEVKIKPLFDKEFFEPVYNLSRS